MATDEAPTPVFPIGHCIGAHYDVGASSDNFFFQVRIGPDVVRLSPEEFVVWGLAHGTPDRPVGRSWDRHSVIAAGHDAGLLDPERVLIELVAGNVLVEATTGTDSAVEFARRHRMLPLMLGLGNTADEPQVYAAGMIGAPIVLMSSMIYDLFAWAHLDTDIWSACQGAAETAARMKVADGAASDPLRLLDALLTSLHMLLSPNAICLDARLVS